MKNKVQGERGKINSAAPAVKRAKVSPSKAHSHGRTPDERYPTDLLAETRKYSAAKSGNFQSKCKVTVTDAMALDEGVFVSILCEPAATEAVALELSSAAAPGTADNPAAPAWQKLYHSNNSTLIAAFFSLNHSINEFELLIHGFADFPTEKIEVAALHWRHANAVEVAQIVRRNLNYWNEGFRDRLRPDHGLIAAIARAAAASRLVHGRRHPFKGAIDGVVDKYVHGWIYDSRKPHIKYPVQIYCNGEIVARGHADQYRDDLGKSGMGDGACHYKIPVSDEIFTGKPAELELRTPEMPDAIVCTHVINLTPTEKERFPRLRREALLNWASDWFARKDATNTQAIPLLREASFHQEIGATNDARRMYEELISIVGPNPISYFRLAEIFFLESNWESSKRYLATAKALCEPNPHLYVLEGDIFFIFGDIASAEECYRRSDMLLPNYCLGRERSDLVCPEAYLTVAEKKLLENDTSRALSTLAKFAVRYKEQYGRAIDLLQRHLVKDVGQTVELVHVEMLAEIYLLDEIINLRSSVK